jgi:hypothetical protein
VVVCLILIGVHLMFFFWPFRYREVHPLLQEVFRSRVDVQHYHRTYFPHPGFEADNVALYRHGDTSIPPLATIQRMQVVGTWSNLLFHPHELYQIRLTGLHVQIPPRGTVAHQKDFDHGVMSTSDSKMQINGILADQTTLDFLQPNHRPPVRFQFARLEIHNVRQGQPMEFAMRVTIPGPGGTVVASGWLGPLQTQAYSKSLLRGDYILTNADLSRVSQIAGHVAGSGHYSGTLAHVLVTGDAAIPDFRAGSAHQVRLDAKYQVTVNGTNGDVAIEHAAVTSAGNVITTSGLIAGTPKKVTLTLETRNSSVADLLDMVEESNPETRGKVSFQAAVEFQNGPEEFLKRLHLTGKIALADVHFDAAGTQGKMDAFSSRVRLSPPAGPKDDPPAVTAEAHSDTRFDHGMAYFPDVQVTLPGLVAHMHGTFNLLNTQVHFTGKLALQRGISHTATGWKAWLMKPLTPFFRHRDAGTVVAIAVTGTSRNPKIQQNLLHNH